MSSTLYRKYRPAKFSEVVSQEHIKTTLQNELSSGKIAHAYLFSGPRGIGKTTVARIMAKALNCHKRNGNEPCAVCPACLEIQECRSLDLVEIDAASNRGINEIKELKEQVKYAPINLKYKIFIIDEAHMLTPEAFNALLKTLEEPPLWAIFILATTEAHKVPETILSRCQRFDFKKVPFSEVARHLSEIVVKEEIEVSEEVLLLIARTSEGYLRDALSLLGQVISLGEKRITLENASLVLPMSDWNKAVEFCILLIIKKTKEALNLIGNLFDEGFDLEHFTKTIIEVLRKMLIARSIGNWRDLYNEFGEQLFNSHKDELEKIEPSFLVFALETVLQAQLDFKQTSLVQLPLEIAAVKITGGQIMLEGDLNDKYGAPSAGYSGNTIDKQDSKNSMSDLFELKDQKPEKVEKETEAITNQEVKIKIADAQIDFGTVKDKWPEVIEALKEFNHSLAASAKLGVPIKVIGSKIVMGFKFRFHFERLMEKKNLEKIENVLERVFQAKMTIGGEIDENFIQENFFNDRQKCAEAVKNVLNALGGEVVS